MEESIFSWQNQRKHVNIVVELFVLLLYECKLFHLVKTVILSSCLSGCPLVYLKYHTFTPNFLHITHGRDSVLLGRQCNVMVFFRFCGWRHIFHIMGPVGQNQARCYISSSLPAPGAMSAVRLHLVYVLEFLSMTNSRVWRNQWQLQLLIFDIRWRSQQTWLPRQCDTCSLVSISLDVVLGSSDIILNISRIRNTSWIRRH